MEPDSAAAPPAWQIWLALGIVYVLWGSTWLGIRVVVDTMPPLLSAATRFLVAGGAIGGLLAARSGFARLAVTRGQLAGSFLIGSLLMGANGLASLAEQEVPSALTALLFASVPLWVVVFRRLAGERPSAATMLAIIVGFAGVAVLVRPGEQSAGASALALGVLMLGTFAWAVGTFLSSRVARPSDALAFAAWQMVLGGALLAAAGLAAGEPADIRPDAFSAESLFALGYLVVFGSVVAFSAFAWLLQHAPVSKVATYAYVNPAVAIALGWLILGETITPLTIAASLLIIASVAIVVRYETPSSA